MRSVDEDAIPQIVLSREAEPASARLQASCIDGCSDSETALVAIRSSYAL
jgi:hypothetical protein